MNKTHKLQKTPKMQIFNRNQFQNKPYKAHSKTIIVLGMLFITMILSINSVSSFDFVWDNYKQFNRNEGRYGSIEIYDKSLFGADTKLGKVTLIENTDYCYINCYAILKLELKDTYNNPFNQLDFYNDKSKSIKKFISNIIYHKTERGNYERYNYEALDTGTHYFRIEGNKQPKENVEWIPTFLGMELEEYANWYSTLDDNLFTYYDFESGGGTTVIDRINGTATGTLLGTPLPTWIDGKVGNYAVHINGSNGYVSIKNTSEINDVFGGDQSKNRTINFWVNMTEDTMLIGKGDGTNNENWWGLHLSGGATSYYQLYSYKLTTQYMWVRTKDRPPTQNTSNFGNWTMITLVKRDTGLGYGNYTLYVNNISLAWDSGSDNNPQNNICNQNSSLTIGNKTGTNAIVGANFSFDDLAIWNRVLTTQEISDLYNNGSGLAYQGGALDVDVTLNNPIDNFNSITDISFNGSFSINNGNLTNTTLFIWYPNGSLYNTNSIIITGIINTSNLSFSISEIGKDYSWNYYACGENSTTTYCEFASTNKTFNYGLILNSETYNTTTFEMSIETFVINFSVDTSTYTSISASLIYNGTSYLGTKTENGNKLIFTKSINIPSIIGTSAQNKSFYWEILPTTGSYNSTMHNQSVNPIILSICNATYPTPIIINFTIYNETSREFIAPTMDATFIYYLGDGTTDKNYSYSSGDSTANTYHFCSNSNKTFTVNAVVQIQNVTSNERNYYFNKESWNNKTTNIHLYMQDGGRNIIVQVRDTGLVPVKDYYVEVDRYYPGTNEYEIIERAKTDEYGQFVARLIEPNTVKYRFRFKNSNNIVMKETSDMTIACRTSICVIPFIIEDTTDDFESFENITNYDYSFSFNNNTNIFTFTWNDISGVSATNRLQIERYLWNGTTLVCNFTSSNAAGTLTCNVGNSEASYQGQVFRKVNNGDEIRIGFLNIKVGDTYQIYGREGLLWSFFLLMIMISIGYYKPPVGILLYLTGIVLLSFMGIIHLSPAVLIAQFVIGIIFIWAFKG